MTGSIKRSRTVAVWLCVMTVACGLISLLGFALLSRAVPQPLLPKHSFVNLYDFNITNPDPALSFLTARSHDDAELIENASNRTGSWHSIPGEASSRPFRPPRFLMVPMRGLTYEDDKRPGPYPEAFRPGDASIALVCEVDGRRIELLTAPSQQWFHRFAAVPAHWCSSDARIVARAVVPGIGVGFGTPFRVGWLEWLVSGSGGAAMALALALLVVGLQTAPWLVDADIAAQRRVASALPWSAGGGLLIYVLGSRGVGIPILTWVAIATLSMPSVFASARILIGNVRVDINAIAVWIAGLLGMGGLVLLTYSLLPLNNGSWLPNYAFAPVAWSTDNQLSVMMAKNLLQHGPGIPAYLGGWSVTDRGVAPAGMLSGLFLLLRLVGGFEDNPSLPMISHFFSSNHPGMFIVGFAAYSTRRRLGRPAFMVDGGMSRVVAVRLL